MLDGTPVLDLKPYLSNVPDAELRRGRMDGVDDLGAPRRQPDATGPRDIVCS